MLKRENLVPRKRRQKKVLFKKEVGYLKDSSDYSYDERLLAIAIRNIIRNEIVINNSLYISLHDIMNWFREKDIVGDNKNITESDIMATIKDTVYYSKDLSIGYPIEKNGSPTIVAGPNPEVTEKVIKQW